ncbi:MAG TPA: hypothetical protein DEQ28_04280, partial [Clostridiales bacterium]|nr:hypothetical protein [Clostridiales bacterium]
WDEVLGLDLAAAAGQRDPAARKLPGEVLALVEQRRAARSEREWDRADALRQQIASLGYTVEDGPTGPRVRRIRASAPS